MSPSTPTPQATPVTPRAAATTLILRDGAPGLEVLMVRRSMQASFMPGAYVFPGGAVDSDDGSAAAAALCDESSQRLAQRIGAVTEVGDLALAFAVAALRECFEECGLWLGVGTGQGPAAAASKATITPTSAPTITPTWATLRSRLHAGESLASLATAAGTRLHTSALQPWSHWVTPAGMPKRFDTLFFVVQAPPEQVPEVDAGETTTLAWVHPPEALAACARGEFQIEFATRSTVESLLPFASTGTAALLAHAASLTHLPPLHPRLQRDAKGRIAGVLLPGQPGYEEAGAAG